MTDPLEALGSLVETWRRDATNYGEDRYHVCADELEPILQQLKEERAKHEQLRDDIVNERMATVSALRFSEREWRDKAQDKIAEVESLRAERERYRRALEVADVELGFVYEELEWPTTLGAHEVVKHALQASSPKEMGEIPEHMYPPGMYPVAKDSDTPEKCPTCGGKNPAKPYGPKAGTWSGNPCLDPFHTQPSDTEEKP